MRQPVAALAIVAVVVICFSATACNTGHRRSSSDAKPTSRTMVPRPLVPRELPALLLSPQEVGAAMGLPAMTVTGTEDAMADNSATMAPKECLAIDGAAEAAVYADSGLSGARDQTLHDGDKFTKYVKQAVVVFPTVEQARAFFDGSAKNWPACHEYTHTQSKTQWSPGPVSNEKGILSLITNQRDAAAPGWSCGRALALRNNVIVDVNTCAADPGDSAYKIAEQIGAKVTSR